MLNIVNIKLQNIYSNQYPYFSPFLYVSIIYLLYFFVYYFALFYKYRRVMSDYPSHFGLLLKIAVFLYISMFL